jgi:hypothetical protein
MLLGGCGGAAAPPPVSVAEVVTPPAPSAVVARAPRPSAPVDALAVLLTASPGPASWVTVGDARLELGGPTIEAAVDDAPIAVRVVERSARLVRVAFAGDKVRFLLWTDAERLLGVVRRNAVVSSHAGGEYRDPSRPAEALLNAGAQVVRLAHANGYVQVRYRGGLEVEGWLPDAAIAEDGDAIVGASRILSGARGLLVSPGTVIRAEPAWAARSLAVVADAYLLDQVGPTDADGWTEVEYRDQAVTVHGFTSIRQPPGRLHRPAAVDPPPPTTPPDTALRAGTCLYGRVAGELVGYLPRADTYAVQPAERDGWWRILVDTPWGEVAFAAPGSAPPDLATCVTAAAAP